MELRTCFEKTGRNEFVGIISQTLPLVRKTCATTEIRKKSMTRTETIQSRDVVYLVTLTSTEKEACPFGYSVLIRNSRTQYPQKELSGKENDQYRRMRK